MSRYWTEKVKNIKPYVPGEQPKDRAYVKLNTNENPYPPSPKVQDAIRSATDETLRLYPDPESGALCESLHVPQTQDTGLGAVIGKWPGTETDEEVAEQLREMS